MNDIKKAATERAARTRITPVGASFESERQRAKSALVKQLDSLDGKNIRKIAALSEDSEKEDKVLRVAAYCRVSTDDIDQAISITFQIREYKRKILANPDWKYVGTYVDDGFSETNTDHRQGFQKLMKDLPATDGWPVRPAQSCAPRRKTTGALMPSRAPMPMSSASIWWRKRLDTIPVIPQRT